MPVIDPVVTLTVVDAVAVLSVIFASFSELKICAVFVSVVPFATPEPMTALNVKEPLAPGASDVMVHVSVRPSALTEHEPVQDPGLYVTPVGSVSVSWMPFAEPAAPALFE